MKLPLPALNLEHISMLSCAIAFSTMMGCRAAIPEGVFGCTTNEDCPAGFHCIQGEGQEELRCFSGAPESSPDPDMMSEDTADDSDTPGKTGTATGSVTAPASDSDGSMASPSGDTEASDDANIPSAGRPPEGDPEDDMEDDIDTGEPFKVGEPCSESLLCESDVCGADMVCRVACSPDCAAGAGCTDGKDCASGKCTEGVCAQTCEADCDLGQPCADDSVCNSGRCIDDVCTPSCAPDCSLGESCYANEHCESQQCSAAGVCVDCSEEETCDGKDNDCDGAVDESDPMMDASCETGNKGLCSAGTLRCEEAMLRCTQTHTAAANEDCGTAEDDDCDGLTDERDATGCSYFGMDEDGDGYYAAITCACAEPPNTTPTTLTEDNDPNDCQTREDAYHTEPMRDCPRKSDLQFDWNHDGIEELEATTEGQTSDGSSCSAGWLDGVPECGDTGSWLEICASAVPGSDVVLRRTQGCR